MKFIMATEAQRLISISLAKIAASRCVRGGVSLHKNLLVATVLQKARYIFMEEAFHMVNGHYINQANSKFIQQLRYQEQLESQMRENDDDDDESTQISDSELNIFSSSSTDSHESLNFLDEPNNKNTERSVNKGKHNNPLVLSSSTTELIYLDLDVNSKSKILEGHNQQNSNSIGQKRRIDDSDDDSDDNILSIFPKSKHIKFSSSSNSNNNNNELTKTLIDDESKMSAMTTNSNNNSNNNNSITKSEDIKCLNNNLSLDFLSNDLNLTSGFHSSNAMMAPLDMSNNTSALSSSPSSTTTNSTNPPISPTSSSIDRITSLVSIFNFGTLQRSVSTPDLCSSNHSSVDNACCNIQQRQIAMTV